MTSPCPDLTRARFNLTECAVSCGQHHECYVPSELRVFEMIITPDMEYPLICVDARRGYESGSLQLDMINLVSRGYEPGSLQLDMINLVSRGYESDSLQLDMINLVSGE